MKLKNKITWKSYEIYQNMINNNCPRRAAKEKKIVRQRCCREVPEAALAL